MERSELSIWGVPHLRELLDPAAGATIALPPDDLLTGDLTAAHWRVQSGGKILIESKDDIRRRIGRSTDAGDAVVPAFAPRARRDVYFVAPGTAANLDLLTNGLQRATRWHDP